jgi:hypothetical protein
MSKIMLDSNTAQPDNTGNGPAKEVSRKPNLFRGRTEAEKGNATFPGWDIVPPTQFINPRIKKQ